LKKSLILSKAAEPSTKKFFFLKEDLEWYQVYIGFNHKKKTADLEEMLELRDLSF